MAEGGLTDSDNMWVIWRGNGTVRASLRASTTPLRLNRTDGSFTRRNCACCERRAYRRPEHSDPGKGQGGHSRMSRSVNRVTAGVSACAASSGGTRDRLPPTRHSICVFLGYMGAGHLSKSQGEYRGYYCLHYRADVAPRARASAGSVFVNPSSFGFSSPDFARTVTVKGTPGIDGKTFER